MPVQYTCLVCGAPVRRVPSQLSRHGRSGAVYCSRECAKARFVQRALADRFWPKVDKSGECWLWTGARDERGYGRIGTGGKHGTALAHRVAWELTAGALSSGAVVCHRCDVPACVRPDHLFLGSQQENLADMRNKGRADSWGHRRNRG